MSLRAPAIRHRRLLTAPEPQEGSEGLLDDAAAAPPAASVEEDEAPPPVDGSGPDAGGDSELDSDDGGSAPLAVGAIPAQGVVAGQTTEVPLDSYFDDTDGVVVRFAAASSDERIVAVLISSRSVLLVGEAPGSATVTVTAWDDDGLTTEQTFEVTAELLAVAVEVSGTTTLHAIGETADLAVTAEFSDGSRRAVDATRVAWASSDAAVATVAGDGTLTAIGRGDAWVTATYSQQTVDVPVSVRVPAVVRVLYAVPADREFRSDYSEALQRAMLGVQSWVRNQLNGLTFALHGTAPLYCSMSEPEEFYARHSWERVLAGVQHCAPVATGSEVFSWAIYADVAYECGPWELGFGLGAAQHGLTIMGSEDLKGLVDEDSDLYQCGEDGLVGPFDFPYGRWEGGAAHELLHTFLVPHPPAATRGCRVAITRH